MMWIQGLDEAPKVVKSCYRSWVDRNPNWDVRMLDLKTCSEYFDIEKTIGNGRKDVSMAHLADIVRINLIADHGGVWVDATCFCVKPLDEWIHEYCSAGFFAFLGHRRDTPISNWLMASHLDCYLTLRIRNEVTIFWQENSFSQQRKGKTYRILKLLLNNSLYTTRFWFSPVVTRVLKVLPYFWFHYLFAELLRKDPKFRDLWEKTPKLDAEIPHRIRKWGMLLPASAEARKVIDEKEDLVYKLSWKLSKFDSNFDGRKFPRNCHLEYLLKSLDG